MSKRTLLIIAAGYEQIPVIKIAHQMDLFVVVSDKNEKAPAITFADDFIQASTYNIEETIEKAKKYDKKRKIDGILVAGADVPLTGAYLAYELGLFGIPIKSAKLASNKLLMKQKFQKDNLPIPWFTEISTFSKLEKLVKERGKNFILKPVDSRGGRGVLQICHVPSLKWAYETSLKHSPSKRLILEEFLSGPQVSTESIVYQGKTYTPGFVDRNYEYLRRFAPYIIENGGEQPSILPKSIVKKVFRLKHQAGISMGIEKGVIKGDIVINRGKPKIIEIAARLSGGYMSSYQIIKATGINLVKVMIKICLGEKIHPKKELVPKFHRGIAIRYWFPRPGKLKNIKGRDKLKKAKWVKLYGFHIKPGEKIEKVTNHTKRVGFVITQGRTREEAVMRAKKVINMIKFEFV